MGGRCVYSTRLNRMKGGWRTVHRKRVFDLGPTLPVFVLRLPVQAIVASLGYRGLASPVLFRKERPGRPNLCAGIAAEDSVTMPEFMGTPRGDG